MLVAHLLLIPEVWDVKPLYKKIIGWESFDLIRFDHGSHLQGQMRVAKLKNAATLLLLVHGVWDVNKPAGNHGIVSPGHI